MDNPHVVNPNEVSYRRFEDNSSLTEEDIPRRPENRKSTDKYFLFAFLACIFILMPFITYTLHFSDISRLDKSNNDVRVSHRSNPFHRPPNGYDYLDVPEVEVQVAHDGSSANLESVTGRTALACCISLVICISLAILFRYATGLIVWIILGLSWSYFFFCTVLLWVLVEQAIVQKIVLTVFTVTLLCILIFMKDKIRLTIMLLKEATNAVFDMKIVFSIPAVGLFISIVIIILCAVTTVYMSTAETKIYTQNGDERYGLDTYMILAIVLNVIIAYWAIQFLSGVQYMMVSGAVTKWYFTRNKDFLGHPVATSIYVTLKYHLGTVAFGSFILTMVAVVRAVLLSLAKNPRLRICVMYCMRYIEAFLRFFTKNSYIVTAMHGTTFIQSGKQAVKLLTLNICNTIGISYIGDFVIVMTHVLVVCLSILATYLLMLDVNSDLQYIGYAFVTVFSIICSIVILGTFETAFSTMFLCVCQDFIMNNGADKPYAMTRNLMEFLDESKRVFSKKIEEKGLPSI